MLADVNCNSYIYTYQLSLIARGYIAITKLNLFYYVTFAIRTAEALSQWEWALHGSFMPERCSLQTFYPRAIQA